MHDISTSAGKNANTGVIHGTVTNLHLGTVLAFKTDGTYRDEQNGTLRFHGYMKDPEGKDTYMSIGVQLSNKDEQTTTIKVGDPRILNLSLAKLPSNRIFNAVSGGVVLERDPEGAITGELKFKTQEWGLVSYEVSVKFQYKAYQP